jgi:alditol oxidase
MGETEPVSTTGPGTGTGPEHLNWARNIVFGAGQLHRPTSLDELRRVVAGTDRIRALGTGHSFNRIADTEHDLVSVAGLPPQVRIDAERGTATVSAGMRYAQVADALQAAGYALPNLASLPHISVAGAVATGTHGSGDALGSLATAVAGLRMVGPEGDLVELRRGGTGADAGAGAGAATEAGPQSEPGTEDFAGAVVALGALGIVAEVTLDVQPTFAVSQYVYEDVSLERVADSFDEVFGAAYSVSVFTGWNADGALAWVKSRLPTGAGNGAASPGARGKATAKSAAAKPKAKANAKSAAAKAGAASSVASAPASASASDAGPAPDWLGARRATEPRHPVPGMPAEFSSEQLGVPGPWHERLPHFRPEFTPSSGEELQSEFLLPREAAATAITALRGLGRELAPVLQISEIRTIAADDLWLSPAYGRNSVAFHFTWVKDTGAVVPVLAAVEERLMPLGARPHWGKLFTAPPDRVAAGYEKAPEFRQLMLRFDPDGKFRNKFVDSAFPQIR